ncbi:MAG: fibronectin type III domain-containing protein [Algicola sp.]|nr:fibronectin type III domain-containing protein [Algicola sp.]
MRLETSASIIVGSVLLALSPLTQATEAAPGKVKPRLVIQSQGSAIEIKVKQRKGYIARPNNISVDVQLIGLGPTDGKVVDLLWQDNAGDEDQYIIERCKQSYKDNKKCCDYLPVGNVAADVTSFHDEPGTGQFKYRVRAINATNNSKYSNEIEI